MGANSIKKKKCVKYSSRFVIIIIIASSQYKRRLLSVRECAALYEASNGFLS